jgi:hypothetical protein
MVVLEQARSGHDAVCCEAQVPSLRNRARVAADADIREGLQPGYPLLD